MFEAGRLKLILRTLADMTVGIVLFLTFLLAAGAYERTSLATHRLGDILSVSSSAGDLLKFSLDDSPLIAAAVVATAVPVPQTGLFTLPPPSSRGAALILLGAVFSMIVAFNIAFFRHLRRVYASPR